LFCSDQFPHWRAFGNFVPYYSLLSSLCFSTRLLDAFLRGHRAENYKELIDWWNHGNKKMHWTRSQKSWILDCFGTDPVGLYAVCNLYHWGGKGSLSLTTEPSEVTITNQTLHTSSPLPALLHLANKYVSFLINRFQVRSQIYRFSWNFVESHEISLCLCLSRMAACSKELRCSNFLHSCYSTMIHLPGYLPGRWITALEFTTFSLEEAKVG
jgi:hypothetical protein